MYKLFDITGKDSEHLKASENYQSVVDLIHSIEPNEPCKFNGGSIGEKSMLVRCEPEEDEKIMIVLLPRICTKRVSKDCYEMHSITIMGQDEMCVVFVMKVTNDDAYAAFNQANTVYEREWHCFRWQSEEEQIFNSDEELELATTGRIDTSD